MLALLAAAGPERTPIVAGVFAGYVPALGGPTVPEWRAAPGTHRLRWRIRGTSPFEGGPAAGHRQRFGCKATKDGGCGGILLRYELAEKLVVDLLLDRLADRTAELLERIAGDEARLAQLGRPFADDPARATAAGLAVTTGRPASPQVLPVRWWMLSRCRTDPGWSRP